MAYQCFRVEIDPMGKPRMTQRDVWAKRECVVRYRHYADRLRAACKGVMPSPVYVGWIAYFAMPASWSLKKKAAHAGQIHQSKPDRDNVDKGILDALFESDQCVADGSLRKRWDDGRGPRIHLLIGDRACADRISSEDSVCSVLDKKVQGDPVR